LATVKDLPLFSQWTEMARAQPPHHYHDGSMSSVKVIAPELCPVLPLARGIRLVRNAALRLTDIDSLPVAEITT
jgi:hypothetical protein